MELILKEAAKAFGKEVTKEVTPIIVKKFLGKTQKLSVKFGLVLTFYEYPLMDEAIALIENCIHKFKCGVSMLKIDDVTFDYYISFELEEFVSPDIDILIQEEPEYAISEQFISLLEILLSPHLKKEVHDKKEVENVFFSGFKLLDGITKCLENEETVATVLKIRSAVKLLGIESELNFAKNIFTELSKKIAKLKLPYSPYVSFSPISKIEGQIGQVIVSLKDAGVLMAIIDAIT